MTTTHDDFLDQAALAAMQMLTPAEVATLEAHLAGCEPCRHAARGYAEAASAMPYGLAPVAPPAGMKAKVFERLLAEHAATGATGAAAVGAPVGPPRLTLVHDAGAERPTGRVAPVAGAGWRAAAVLLGAGLLASLAMNIMFFGRVQMMNGQLVLMRSANIELDVKLARMQREAEGRAAQIAVLQARDTRMAKIPGLQPMARDASAMVFWSPAEQAWLVAASGLPPVQAGKTYQLWAVTAQGEKISMGTFAVGDDGGATVRMAMPRPDLKPAAAAVSLEPMGGMPQPTGPIVMMGELKI